MKTEKEKMLSNELYNHKDAELTKERNHAYELTLRYNQTKDDETELRTSILQQLAGKLGNNVVIKPPFQCDYGYNLILGDNVFMNYGCSILDCNVVEIGNNVLMAPNVQIYAAYHPTDHTLRLKDLEYADRVKIGDNTWIGGGSIILNGVTIGKNTVIGAGSVVTKDIPDNVVAVGNPCRVIKRLDKENVENGKRLKFTDFAHINIVVDDIDEGIKYYEQLLEAKPIQIFREFSNIGFAKAAGFLEHPELVKLSIAFMEIPGTKLTLELMEYYEPVTTDAKHREDVNKINGVRHVALEIQNIDEAFKYIKTCPDITLINPSEQYGPLAYEGTITKQLPVFIQVVVIVMVGHYIWLAMLYLIAGAYAGRNPLEVLKHYGAAYITAVGTMSSAATLAVALRCARKSKVLRNDMIDFGIPLFANIHLCGSVLTETFFVMVVSKILYGDIPDMKMMVLFCILLGIFAIGAPGVPGGTVMASLGLITGILGFNETGTALILTVFALQDSFGTACNITGDGALTLILTGYANRHGISEKTVKNSDC